MADEGNLGVARALDTNQDATNADLQLRVEEARESISEAVAEIKEAVVNQYDAVKESVTEALDWREQFRKRPVVWSVGALGVGIFVGYSLCRIIEGEDESDFRAESQHLQTSPGQIEGGGPSAFTEGHSYAAHARAVARVSDDETASNHDKPGLVDRFKESRAYDRMQEEVSDLGNRFIDELFNAARTFVLPALFVKVQEIIGIDLSHKRQSRGSANPQADLDPNVSAQTPSSSQHQPQELSEPDVSVLSESGKPAYPRTKAPSSRFDRFVSDTSTQDGVSDNTPHLNLNYDDRYERESQLFTRGEARGFGADTTGENKTPAVDDRNTDRVNAPRGKDYSYERGRTDNS